MARRQSPLSEQMLDGLAIRELARGDRRGLLKAARPGPVGRATDGVIGAVAPTWGRRRKMSRLHSALLSGDFDVTRPGRTRRKAKTTSGSADKSLDDRSLWALREICRDHDRNSCLLHGIIDRVADNVAGPEFGFRPASKDEGYNRDVEALLADSSTTAEASGRFDLQELIYTAFRTVIPDGDLLLVHLDDGTIQAIEGHELVTPSSGRGYLNRRVVNGVEIDEAGRPAAYYVAAGADRLKPYYWIVSDWTKARRIEAADAEHVANRTRFSQSRGLPVLASCLDLFDRLDGYLDSETLTAELCANLAWFIKKQGAETLPGTEVVEDDNATADSDSTYDRVLRSEPGQVFDLLPGEDMGVVESRRPNDSFEPYVVAVLRMVGAGVGIPLELVLLDFSKTNYSSARAALLQAYRSFRRWQRFVASRIVVPVYRRWVSRWIAGRELPVVDDGYALRLYPPRWAWIDPYKEVLAHERATAAGFRLLEDVIAEEGRKLEDFVTARKRELDMFREAKIPTTTAPQALAPPPAAADAAAIDEGTEKNVT